MDSRYIKYERRDDLIAVVTLNYPEKRNALTPVLAGDLVEALGEAERDDNVHVIVLTGAGKAFCAGGDVGRFSKRVQEGSKISIDRIGMWGIEIAKIDKPIVAAINGASSGAGVSLALLCDIRVASEQAEFMFSFTRMGLIPDFGMTYVLPRVLGMGKALELFYTAGKLSVGQALEMGLINKVVTHDKLIEEAVDMARSIAKGPSIAHRLIKRAVYRELVSCLYEQIQLEGLMQNITLCTEDHKEALRAFLEKKSPNFQG